MKIGISNLRYECAIDVWYKLNFDEKNGDRLKFWIFFF